jgi:cytochrome bd-type quinol oxidase subunit 2
MVGGVAAALAGLVFIAMSINLPIITRDATHKNRAVATMTGFTAVFMICAFALIGNQNYQWIGVEWLVVTLVPTITCIRVYVLARKTGRSSVGLSIGRFIAGTAC